MMMILMMMMMMINDHNDHDEIADKRGPNPDQCEPLHRRRQLSYSQFNSRGCKEFRGFAQGISFFFF